jgi:hypothetical protein
MVSRSTVHAQIAEYVRTHPAETYDVISAKLNVGYSTLTRIVAKHGIRRETGRRLRLRDELLNNAGDLVEV